MMGKLQYHQYTASDAARFNDAQTSMIYEYEGNVSFGFNGCIGVSKKLSKNMALFIELTAAHQNFSPHSVKEYIIFKEGRSDGFRYNPLLSRNNIW